MEELDDHAREMHRVLKPGARYACSEYPLTPHFDGRDDLHVALHRKFLPTLSATQTMYPADVCAALEQAGFSVLVSGPSKSEAWPLCEQRRDLILNGRRVVRASVMRSSTSSYSSRSARLMVACVASRLVM